MGSNSKGMVFVEMSPELAEFVIETCEERLRFCEGQVADYGTLIFKSQAEKFNMLKNATKRAMR